MTALDVATGERAVRVRTGIGIALNNHYAAVTLGPHGATGVARMTGMVRIADRP